jgi:hypothetical protein
MATQSKSVKKRELWQALIRKWEKSGLSRAVFCRKAKLNPNNFNYWKEQFGRKSHPGEQEGFVQVNSPLLTLNNPYYEIMIGDSIRIRVSNAFHPFVLKNLVRTLREV